MTIQQARDAYLQLRRLEARLAQPAFEFPASGDALLAPLDVDVLGFLSGELGDLDALMTAVDDNLASLTSDATQRLDRPGVELTLGDFARATHTNERLIESLLLPGGPATLPSIEGIDPPTPTQHLTDAFKGTETHLLTLLGFRLNDAKWIANRCADLDLLIAPRRDRALIPLQSITSGAQYLRLQTSWTEQWRRLLDRALTVGAHPIVRRLVSFAKIRAAVRVILEADGHLDTTAGRYSEMSALAYEFFDNVLETLQQMGILLDQNDPESSEAQE